MFLTVSITVVKGKLNKTCQSYRILQLKCFGTLMEWWNSAGLRLQKHVANPMKKQ